MDKIKENLAQPKIRKWRRTLDDLLQKSGRDMKWLCEYTGATYNKSESNISFYEKLPRKRTTYIGIGMAFRQPLHVINQWIEEFSTKKKLYVKDISEDLVWIYLIQLSCDSDDSEANYYKRYEECQGMAFAAYNEVWEQVTSDSLNTAEVEVLLDKAEHDQDFHGLTRFIKSNIDSFKTAYRRPRQYLDHYIEALFRTELSGENGRFINLNRMRGYLDDSMVNYLSGDHTTINTYDWKNRRRTCNIKYIPKDRKFHISLCLALGMNAGEMNEYLDLMGYAPLRQDDKTEKLLTLLLDEWEKSHPLQRALKARLLTPEINASPEGAGMLPEEYQAFQEELLFLRQEMYNGFMENGITFPYMKK